MVQNVTGASNVPDEEELQRRLRAIEDRLAISDLLVRFARCLDEKDWDGYVALYTEDGVLRFPWGGPRGTDVLRADVEHNLARFHATHHISANHRVEIDGDEATSRSYVQSVHVADPEADEHWTMAGWYDCIYRRTPDGWKFTEVAITPVWQTGAPPDWADE
jgi:ketosteroid isomerase-like protein